MALGYLNFTGLVQFTGPHSFPCSGSFIQSLKGPLLGLLSLALSTFMVVEAAPSPHLSLKTRNPLPYYQAVILRSLFCQFSHQLFTNTSLSPWTFLQRSFRLCQLGGLYLVLISLWVLIPRVRSLLCIYPTGCISSKYLSGLKFIVFIFTARFLFILSLTLGVFF